MEGNTRRPGSEDAVLQREFPWGIRCASLLHPVDQSVLPGLLPTEAGGLLVSYPRAHEQVANALVEYAVASLLHAVPYGLAKVEVMDLGIRKRFHQLSTLPARIYEICNNERDVNGFLAQIDGDLRRRYHTVLSDEILSISDFNAANPYSEKYHVIVIEIDSVIAERHPAQLLTKLLRECLDGGYYPILMNCEDRQGEHKQLVCDAARALFPEVALGQDGQLRFSASQGDAVGKLTDICERFGLGVQPVAEKASALVAEIAAREKTSSEKDFITIPIGRTADGRAAVNFSLGNLSGCYHAFIMGVTGMGKTSLLNNLIVQIAEQFTSREIQLYLMDYKEGTEFQIFDTHPNCKRIHLDNSDLQAAESLLLEFQAAIAERARLFKAMRQDIKGIDHYNALNPAGVLPRLFLIIDEVQCLLTGKTGAGRFSDLLKDVVKRGRSFGVHIILSTQTLSGFSVDNELMSQIGLRIGFKLSLDSDCTHLLEFGNGAPRQLDKFQIIYNPNFGLKHANVFAYTDNVGSSEAIRARIDKVLATRDPALILKPQITLHHEPATDAAHVSPTAAAKANEKIVPPSEIFAAFDSSLNDVEAMLERERLEDEARLRSKKAAI